MNMKAAIIGTGNIACDLMVKLMRSPYLECSLMAGRNLESPGSCFAKQRGITVSDRSIEAIIDERDNFDIIFDATSAATHIKNAPILNSLNKFVIDLTPAKLGLLCVPVINLEDALKTNNVNLVTCGGQAALPIARAIAKIHPETTYIESVSTISSKSAGIATRDNIDEFTQTTKDALSYFTGISRSKSIIILNPAEPPIHMRATVYALVENPNMTAVCKEIQDMVEKVKKYVPGYNYIMKPIYKDGKITVSIEVIGLGDYLPPYAGNLDIITCAAIKIAETYAQKSRGSI